MRDTKIESSDRDKKYRRVMAANTDCCRQFNALA
jgi:hypothetical protein